MPSSRESPGARRALCALRAAWPALRERLRATLVPAATMAHWLSACGAASHPSDLGVTVAKLAADYRRARLIRRRYTILDCLEDLGWLDIRGGIARHRRRILDRCIDDAAAEADVAVVEHEVLPGRRRPLRRVELRANRRIAVGRHDARRIGHPVARLRAERRRQRGRVAGDPVHGGRVDVAPIQQRVIVPLHGDQCIARACPCRRRTTARRAPSRVPPMRRPCRCPIV